MNEISRRAAFEAMAEAYRRWGWLAADLDPLSLAPRGQPPQLSPGGYGFLPEDAEPLRQTYCRRIGWEIGHIQNAERRDWLVSQAETAHPPADLQRAIDLIAQAELFEDTCYRRMPTAKTFGLAGAEGLLVLAGEVLRAAHEAGQSDVYVGGMHRGRLTQMALLFGKPLAQVIADAQGVPEFPHDYGASSDSPYHLGWHGLSPIGPRVWIAPHPSHLSIVAPVALGRARAAMENGREILSVALHTDAAFAGQGVNGELLQLSELPAFSVGGTVHLVLNNQIGFTTDMRDARTSRSCTDYAKLVEAPILHVNGEDPDALCRAARVAAAYRNRFKADVVVECIAYRRRGHNEIDEPRFTQPRMYRRIDEMTPLSRRLAIAHGLEPDLGDLESALDKAFDRAKAWRPNVPPAPVGLRADINRRMSASVRTGLPADVLRDLGLRLTRVPGHIALHPKTGRFLHQRREALASGSGIDWATAEALAIASLAAEGCAVRFGGQDTARGAFSQRNLYIHCNRSDDVHFVFDGIGTRPQIHNTPLIENAVLGFEYGYSTGKPSGLTIWEAQFGDFLNVCQAIFDQFIVCGEDRWLLESNLVMLLPHGIDGGGPDHATAHPERLLMACARNNIQVMNPSTPANFFHALRRQVLADWRKPLVVLAPKALLRHPAARSELSEFSAGFAPVIERKGDGKHVVMSSGKLAVLLEAEDSDVTLLRLEQFYPFPEAALAALLALYPDAELIWAQEEPENMGYFQWLAPQLERIAGRPWRLVTRPANPAASSGPKSWDDRHLKTVIDTALSRQEGADSTGRSSGTCQDRLDAPALRATGNRETTK
ncbi:thiamine pyrophosphate-dependent enzyme [Oceanibacterium hippocampi]|uniref:2-oxoglutarate dehydrogenase E1 component n=1 Tax=Oceanibacterium hippocampi TaxID=745714 RepID=A0A1Y5TJC3_9PROT|nr:thiamine pyrophosphate-dependent enzyme [Oceanibacterium hippocampi]SLN65650.1 2-oxoglutarate dehydrogenase E1 component [Oceanibacterium hippocampi]